MWSYGELGHGSGGWRLYHEFFITEEYVGLICVFLQPGAAQDSRWQGPAQGSRSFEGDCLDLKSCF